MFPSGCHLTAFAPWAVPDEPEFHLAVQCVEVLKIGKFIFILSLTSGLFGIGLSVCSNFMGMECATYSLTAVFDFLPN